MWQPEGFFIVLTLTIVNAVIENEFSRDFLFGVGSAAYQVEGAWNISDKGESIWDRFVHTRPNLINNGSTADVASDFYHKFKEDIQLVKNIGANVYRFSLSWSRILPNGFSHRISKDGVRFYNDVINECISNGIKPMVSLYHWDLPQKLQDLGGWTNPDIILWFADYAEVAFELFGDRVKMWITMNEPNIACSYGYGNAIKVLFAPAVNQSGEADYLCGHYTLLAHAKVYALYQKQYRSKQNGVVGIALLSDWFQPEDDTSIADIAATERARDFFTGWFAHPIFSAKGDYPEIMKTRISEKSKQQGYDRSRLPEFTREQIDDIKHSADFIGINYYSIFNMLEKNYGNVEFSDDAGIMPKGLHLLEKVNSVENKPRGLSRLLQDMTSKYQLPIIYITENGYNEEGSLKDVERTTYLHDHLQEVLKIIRNGIDIKGYFVWSLTDNFEWNDGYKNRFGLFNVDFNKPDRPRTPKLSSKFITEVYSTRRIPNLSNILRSSKSIRNSINRVLIYLTFCHMTFIW